MWDVGLRIADCRLPIADCACLTAIAGRDWGLRLLIVDCGLRLPDGDSWQGLGIGDCGLRIGDWGLGIMVVLVAQ